MATPASGSGNVLFFVPDIGGFTKFVTETEVSHSQHIVKDLLELLVDANRIGLEVSEFEGDAVLFFRTGAPPTLDELLGQAKTMFVAFHSYLKRMEFMRICQCGACAGASHLALKFVAHLGPASTMDVKGHKKFIGKSIIVTHRLLKNSVPEPEYLLLTEDTLQRLAEGGAAPELGSGSNHYDEIGEVAYRYHPMAVYRSEAKAEPPEPFRLDNPRLVMSVARRIAAPPADVFQRLIDLPARVQWIEGVKRVDLGGEEANYIGKRHRCIRDADDPEIVTSEVKVNGPSSMEFWETDTKKMSALRYRVEAAPGDATLLTMEVYVRDTLLLRLMFSLVMRKKLEPLLTASLDNLAATFTSAAQEPG